MAIPTPEELLEQYARALASTAKRISHADKSLELKSAIELGQAYQQAHEAHNGTQYLVVARPGKAKL